MLNQAILVGRVFAVEDGLLTIKIPRNSEDKEEADLISARMQDNVNESVQEYCKKGDIVGIKGNLRNDGNGMYLNINKITFLTSSAKED